MWREGGICLAYAAAVAQDNCCHHYITGPYQHHVHTQCSVCNQTPLSARNMNLQLAEVAGWLQTTIQQVVGVADARVEAPNGQPIQPRVEPLSEAIKYSLFDMSVAEVDVHLMEGDGLLRLQVHVMDCCEHHVMYLLTCVFDVFDRVQVWTWECAGFTATVKR